MPDAAYEDLRMTALYDPVDGVRPDLEVYVDLVDELGARSVLDLGCGTGTLALMLADRGLDVFGVDPAAGMLHEARGKTGADRVRWVHGTAVDLPAVQVDLAVMTGNVAQAIIDPGDWSATLAGVRAALRPGGHLVLETRDPARRAWEEWTREASWTRRTVPGLGLVESWYDLLEVRLPLVTFRGTSVHPDGTVLVSESTLRFRDRDEVQTQLRQHGYTVLDVRDAPDRPGREFVFIAQSDPLTA